MGYQSNEYIRTLFFSVLFMELLEMLKEHIKKQTAPLGAIPVKRAPRKSQGEGCSSPGAGAGGEEALLLVWPC